MAATVAALVALDLVLIVLLLRQRSDAARPGVTLLSIVALVVLPAFVLLQGARYHLERSKSTSFCLSCHVMESYGKSLWVDSADHLPANHFQNRRIDREQACYVCHTSYAMFGDLQAKIAGAQHLLVNYLGTIPETIELYQPYSNDNCLHCHEGARAYEENDLHGGEESCLECHDLSHDIGNVDDLPSWGESFGGSP